MTISDASVNGHAADPTGAGLLAFLDFAMSKGYLKQATGQSMKTACKEVLSATEGDGWEAVDLLSLDVDDVARRFETLRAMKFSTGSLNTYKGRFKKSFDMFEDFRANPGGWRPDLKTRNRTPKSDAQRADTVGPLPQTQDGSRKDHTPGPNVITYPFPLREGVLASIQLPSDLTKREAKRLAAFVDSIAVEDQPALPAGRPALTAPAEDDLGEG